MIMRYTWFYVFILSICFSQSLFAQIVAEPSSIDFGVIEQNTDRVVDIKITNHSDQAALLLRSGFTFEYRILQSQKTIQPGESVTLRVKYTPRSKGVFNEDIALWYTIMDQPVMLTYKGDVQYIDNTDNPECPSFNARPEEDCCPENDFLAEIYDNQTGDPIRDARLRIIQQGTLQKTLLMDRNGQSELAVPIAYYYLIADAEGYFPADSATYINRRNNSIRFYLDPLPQDQEIEAIAVHTEEVVQAEKEVVEEIKIRIDFSKEKEETETEPIPEPVVVQNEDENLPESRFGRNNVVILVDISQSMNQGGKMDLLKASMFGLADVIRDIDNVSLITYASHSEVILEKATGSDREKLREATRSLEAGGMTAGADGFKTAYALVLKNFIEGGNNQVIVATDGAFRAADQEKIDKLVRKHTKKKVKTTVIGIKSTSGASRTLAEIAELGRGTFIHMEDYDASKYQLVEEIKSQSSK
jgi:Ca-activated chloride channel homolog